MHATARPHDLRQSFDWNPLERSGPTSASLGHFFSLEPLPCRVRGESALTGSQWLEIEWKLSGRAKDARTARLLKMYKVGKVGW